MKKSSVISFLISLFFIPLIVSCQKDDIDPLNIGEVIVGVWIETDNYNVIEIKKNGTGVRYTDVAAYRAQSSSGIVATIKWRKLEDVSAIEYEETASGETKVETLIASLFSDNEILWMLVPYPFGGQWEWERYK